MLECKEYLDLCGEFLYCSKFVTNGETLASSQKIADPRLRFAKCYFPFSADIHKMRDVEYIFFLIVLDTRDSAAEVRLSVTRVCQKSSCKFTFGFFF